MRYLIAVLFSGLFLFGCAKRDDGLFLSSGTKTQLDKDFRALPSQVIEGGKSVVSSRNNVNLLLLGGAASVVLNQGVNNNTAEYFEKHEIFPEGPDRALDLVGGPGFHFGAAGFWYLWASENNDSFNRERAWTMIEALSVTGATTFSLKAIANNKTPNGKDWAWPSGHTSSSFTVAAVLDEFYGPEVGIPAYIGASVVGLRMMAVGDHWASDVAFGAALGWAVGHTIAGNHVKKEVAGFEIVPFTYNSYGPVMGVNLIRQF